MNIMNLTGAILKTVPGNTLKKADLTGADLTGADLTGADLRGANLTGADLRRADLRGADLTGAEVRRANLRRADLRGANLIRANLSGANLSGAKLPNGVKFEDYPADRLPALLTATGKTVPEVVASGCWECHEWRNCPMHIVFGASSIQDIPDWWRAEGALFVALFDGRQLACPTW